MAKSRSRVYHRAKGQVRRDALLHSRSRRLYYRSWTKQAGRRLRLNGTTHESIRGDRVHSGDVKSRRIDPHRPPRSARAAKSWQRRTPTWLAQTKSGTSPAVAAKTRSEQGRERLTSMPLAKPRFRGCPDTATFGRWRKPFRALRQSVATCGRQIEVVVGV